MIDSLIKELDTEMTEAEVNEKNAQEEYEEMMADSAEKRAADSKSLAQKGGQKADTEKALVDAEAEKTSTAKELMATIEYIGQLHGECDWLIKYFDVRKRLAVERSPPSAKPRLCSMAPITLSCRPSPTSS